MENDVLNKEYLLVDKVLENLRECKHYLKLSDNNKNIKHDLKLAYKKAYKAAWVGQEYLDIRKPIYSFEDGKRLCANKLYILWFNRLFIAKNRKIHKKTYMVPFLDDSHKKAPYTEFYVNGVNYLVDKMVIQALGCKFGNCKIAKKNFKKEELKDCIWANDRVIGYFKENIELLDKDKKSLRKLQNN